MRESMLKVGYEGSLLLLVGRQQAIRHAVISAVSYSSYPHYDKMSATTSTPLVLTIQAIMTRGMWMWKCHQTPLHSM